MIIMRSNLPVLETSRLILREICEKDINDMFEYAQLPYVGPDAGWEPHRSTSDTKDVIRAYNRKPYYGQLGVYAIILKGINKMIGTCELHSYISNFKAELGYTINPSYWGKGYAVEASKKIITYGFEKLNLKRIECMCFPNNSQSKRVCEKLKLRYEGYRKKAYQLYDGSIHDLECYAITDDEYKLMILNGTWEY